MEEYKIGLVIGRFQPLHKGHISLIKEGLTIADKLIIAIGSANVLDFDNPFPVIERENLLQEVLKKEKLMDSIVKIIHIDDNPSDDKWLKELLQKTGPIDVVIGNNDRVKGIFERAGYTVREIPYFKRNIYEGRKIRKKMRENNRLILKYYTDY